MPAPFAPLPAQNQELGGAQDSLLLEVNGNQIKLAESYEVKISVLQQPAAFALRVGASTGIGHLLSLFPPNAEFSISIISNGKQRVLQSGIIDSRSCPSAQYAQVEVKGRDFLSPLFDSFVEEEQQFPQKTFADLTRAVLDIVGLTADKGFTLSVTNDSNRALMTGVSAKSINSTTLADQLPTGALTGTGGLVYNTIKAQLGTRYYDFLMQQYKMAGIFLWATPSKKFVLASPRGDQPASFNIFRDIGGNGRDTNVVDCRFQDDTTMRNAEAIVYGRAGGGKKGVEICRGAFVDDEMFNYGFTKKIILRDQDVRDKQSCEYMARKTLAEQRRSGWQLEYTLAGHQAPSDLSDSGIAVWAPDTVVRVDDLIMHVDGDDSLNFRRNFYVESVTYSRDIQSGTRTKVTLMRQADLLFANGITPDGAIIKRKQNKSGGKKTK